MSVSVNKVTTQLPFFIPSIHQIIHDTRTPLGRSLGTLVVLVGAGVIVKLFYIKSNKNALLLPRSNTLGPDILANTIIALTLHNINNVLCSL